jgi:hypothetical protein
MLSGGTSYQLLSFLSATQQRVGNLPFDNKSIMLLSRNRGKLPGSFAGQ